MVLSIRESTSILILALYFLWKSEMLECKHILKKQKFPCFILIRGHMLITLAIFSKNYAYLEHRIIRNSRAKNIFKFILLDENSSL